MTLLSMHAAGYGARAPRETADRAAAGSFAALRDAAVPLGDRSRL